jgi:hypothetical protein
MRLLWAVLLSAVSLFADVSGKWTGSFVIDRGGESKDTGCYFDLKQDGNKITGVGGPSAEYNFPIQKGSIEGDKINLELLSENDEVIVVTLVIDGEEHMTGDAHAEHEGETRTAKIDIKRQK